MATSSAATSCSELDHDVLDELQSWVIHPPRALKLLRQLQSLSVSAQLLKQTKIGVIVARYAKHVDGDVADCAAELVAKWKRKVLSPKKPDPTPVTSAGTASDAQQGTQVTSLPAPKSVARRKRAIVADDDDSDNCPLEDLAPDRPEQRRSESIVETVDDGNDSCNESENSEAEEANMSNDGKIWDVSIQKRKFRNKSEEFVVYLLKNPFGCADWKIKLRISAKHHKPECAELLDQMTVQFGAVAAPQGQENSAQDEQVLQRLRRLEERFRGSGVTEGEARNAMRLFERELSKANWTEDKFAKLKRQLEGSEEWSAGDVVSECALRWIQPGKRRQAWFSDACERVAKPLGLQFGYTDNGGCCFVGPLSSCAGAALTAALVCHFAHLDLERARKSRGGSRTSHPQFLQGFVDGALSPERHLVWEKLFSIEDDSEAARFCKESLKRGFFNDSSSSSTDANARSSSIAPAAREPESDSESGGDEGGEDLQALLRGVFSSGRRGNNRGGHASGANGLDGGTGTASAPTSFQPGGTFEAFKGPSHRLADHDEGDLTNSAFKGSSQKLADDDDEDKTNSARNDSRGGARTSWALTFASNLELARGSFQRSKQEAHKTYHWTSCAHSVKKTKTGTESYSRGKIAGEKRKGQIDSTSGAAKSRFRGGPRLAITQ
eukprot:TRINITY_DN22723_c1_g2_i1.p1 TRINITY_DN22723_c1_g2~~TRINITY_DN22723_c1_g2_i1.p1  ORF type:complete len:666 (-),score=104.18 TRINITY_DN22723_c1_g2_i1:71-2068(-)